MLPGSPAFLAPCRHLFGETLSPLPHTTGGFRHGGDTGARAGHGTVPHQASGASQPQGWHLPPLHPAALPPHHPAHTAGKLSCSATAPSEEAPGPLSSFPVSPPVVGHGQDMAPAASCWQPECCCWPYQSLLFPMGLGALGGDSNAQYPFLLCSGPVMSLRGFSSYLQNKSTGSWSEWALGVLMVGEELPAHCWEWGESARLSHPTQMYHRIALRPASAVFAGFCRAGFAGIQIS